MFEEGRQPPLAVLPLGTGNDLARAHGWGGGYADGPLGEILLQVADAFPAFLDRWTVELGAPAAAATRPARRARARPRPRPPRPRPPAATAAPATAAPAAAAPAAAATAAAATSSADQSPAAATRRSTLAASSSPRDEARAVTRARASRSTTISAWASTRRRRCASTTCARARRRSSSRGSSTRASTRCSVSTSRSGGGASTWKRRLRLRADGADVALPEGTEGLIFLNIDSYAGGARMWRTDGDAGAVRRASAPTPRPRHRARAAARARLLEDFHGRARAVPSQQDGLLEVVALRGAVHLGQIKVGLARAASGSASAAKRRSSRTRTLPMQVDGEPWAQARGRVTVTQHARHGARCSRTAPRARPAASRTTCTRCSSGGATSARD